VQGQVTNSTLAPFVDKLIIKAQQQARYAPDNIGHFGLGFEKYSHFTSPIRRYSDLILHRLLKQTMANDEKGLSHTLKTIDAVCVQVSGLEREAAKTEWDFLDRKFTRWAESNIGQSFEAVVTDADEGAEYPSIVKVTKPFYGPRVFILKDFVPLFATLKVEIVRVDLLKARIYGKVVKLLDEISV
jgi:ribonuclease R